MDIPPFNHPWVDESRAPIFRCKFPDPLPQDEYEAYIAHLDRWVSQTRGYYAWVIYPDLKLAAQRTAMAQSQARRAPFERKYCSCYGFVVENTMMRGVIAAVMWLNSPAVLTKVFDDEDDAFVWVSQIHAHFVAKHTDDAQAADR